MGFEFPPRLRFFIYVNPGESRTSVLDWTGGCAGFGLFTLRGVWASTEFYFPGFAYAYAARCTTYAYAYVYAA